ncbi:MAG: efflux RND transporter periplasmic adaptor subunit [Aquabacterium sp.]|nr:efflux RND transporter periplasmic adaptor subunit [Aquabacterium sp.]
MPPPPARTWLRRSVVLLAIVALIAAALWWASRPKPIPVLLSEVGRGTVETTIANTRGGTIEACQRTRLSTIFGGRIEMLAVKEGDRVRKGQVLMRLWQDDQRAEHAAAAAQAETARRRSAEACTVAETARREAQRQQQLHEQGFVSEARLDAARSEAQARELGCRTARADVTQAQARVAVVATARERSVLVAPFDGTVAKVVGEVGEYSTPSPPGVPTPPAIDLLDDSCVYVKAPMDEIDAPRLRVGLPVRITIDAQPGRSFAGQVRRIAPVVSAVERQARTVEIEVTFDDPKAPGHLLVGSSTDVEVILGTRTDVLRVPTAALLQGGKSVLVRAADGLLQQRSIQTGLANWEHTEVLQGLQAGEQIVVSLDRAGVQAGALTVPDDAQRR